MGNLIVEIASIPGKWPAKTESGSLSGGGSSLCRLLGTTLTASSGCGYNANQRYRRRRRGVIANYIDEFIMFCVGLWMTGVGFGLLQSPFHAQPGQQPWWLQVAKHFKWMGPLLILIAIVLAFAAPS
jgi:hypothetical protein